MSAQLLAHYYVTTLGNDTLLAVTVDATDPALTARAGPCAEADRFAGTLIGHQGHRAPRTLGRRRTSPS